MGSGVYQWLPGKGLQEFIAARLAHYAAAGEIKYASPRRAGKKVVVYCTYGGAHTGVNEAVPAVKFMGQLFDHLGFEIVAEWYYIGEYPAQGRMKDFSASGRLGTSRAGPTTPTSTTWPNGSRECCGCEVSGSYTIFTLYKGRV